jgi:hypothetical protein
MSDQVIYVHQVIGVPGSDVGHLPSPWGATNRWTFCGGHAIEDAIRRLDGANQALGWERSAEWATWWVEPEHRRPCRECIKDFDRDHHQRLDQIRAMGGRP